VSNGTSSDTILEVKDLKMYFPVTRGLLKKKVADVKAVDGVSFKLKKGETLGLVGESGCGKTTIGRCVIRLYQPTAGQIIFEGQDIASAPENKIRPLRRKLSLIFQDPYSSLDPRQSARSIVGEPLRAHHLATSKRDYDERIERVFLRVGLNPSMADRYPHEFSGGQRQTNAIARA
jgi:ABC-type microcin C transport system duplicated ATPase subunit YejF